MMSVKCLCVIVFCVLFVCVVFVCVITFSNTFSSTRSISSSGRLVFASDECMLSLFVDNFEYGLLVQCLLVQCLLVRVDVEALAYSFIAEALKL